MIKVFVGVFLYSIKIHNLDSGMNPNILSGRVLSGYFKAFLFAAKDD